MVTMRALEIDVLECPKCRGRMRVLEYITEQDVIERILTHPDLPTAPPNNSRTPPSLWRVAISGYSPTYWQAPWVDRSVRDGAKLYQTVAFLTF